MISQFCTVIVAFSIMAIEDSSDEVRISVGWSALSSGEFLYAVTSFTFTFNGSIPVPWRLEIFTCVWTMIDLHGSVGGKLKSNEDTDSFDVFSLSE